MYNMSEFYGCNTKFSNCAQVIRGREGLFYGACKVEELRRWGNSFSTLTDGSSN